MTEANDNWQKAISQNDPYRQEPQQIPPETWAILRSLAAYVMLAPLIQKAKEEARPKPDPAPIPYTAKTATLTVRQNGEIVHQEKIPAVSVPESETPRRVEWDRHTGYGLNR